MTIGATRGREISVADTVKAAFHLAGLKHAQHAPDQHEQAMAITFLEGILDHLQVEGVTARDATFETVSLTAGTYQYTLSDSVLTAFGDAMYIPAGEDVDAAGGETVIVPITRGRWQTISSKDDQSRPVMYFPNRAGTSVQVWYWPTPDEAGTVRHQVHKLTADVSDPNATVDLEVYWTQYYRWMLAFHLAMHAGLPVQDRGQMRAEAERMKSKALSYAKQHPPQQMRLHAPVAMSGRRRYR